MLSSAVAKILSKNLNGIAKFYNDEEIKENLSFETFRQNGLNGMVNKVFGNSPYRCMSAAYPSEDWVAIKARRQDRGKYLNIDK